MSRSRHIAKQFKDWWGKRPFSGHSVSNKAGVDKLFKRLLHKAERNLWKKELKKDLDIDAIDPPKDP